MSVKATFVADFTKFQDAVDKAVVKLRTFDDGLEDVDKNLARMGNQFSGRSVIQQAALMEKAIGGVAGAQQLTAKEQGRVNAVVNEALSKYQALGQVAPKSLRDLEVATRSLGQSTDKMAAGMSLMGAQGKAAYDKLQASDKLIAGMSASGRMAAEGLNTAGTSASLFTTKTVALGAAIGTAFGTFATNAVTSLATSVGDLVVKGAKMQGLEQSFNKLASSIGETGTEMIKVTRTATKGLIADLDIMQSSNKAMLLGLPVTANEMGKLANTAVVLGRAMGQDATTSLNDLITALGRSSPMILDNLGLTVKVGEANEIYAKKLGKSAEALTDAEKKTAFYQAALAAAEEKTKALGDASLTAADQVTQLKVAWDNLVTSIGRNGATVIGAVATALTTQPNRPGTFADAKVGGGTAIPPGVQLENDVRALLAELLGGTRRPGVAIGASLKAVEVSAAETRAIERQSKAILEGIKAREAEVAALKKFKAELPEFLTGQFRDFAALQAGGAQFLSATLPSFLQQENRLGPQAPDTPIDGTHLTQTLSQLNDFLRRENVFGPQAPGAVKGLNAFGSLKGLLTDAPNALIGALMGGGNVGASLGGVLGGGLTSSLMGGAVGKSISGALTGSLGKTLGGALGSIIPGLGTAIGSMIGPLIGKAFSGIGKVFGIGKEGAKTNDVRDDFITGLTGIKDIDKASDKLRQMAKEAGIADGQMQRLFGAKKVKDFEAAASAVNDKLKMFADEQVADQERLNEAVQKYGFTFEELAPKLQQSGLDSQAKELIEDWRVLTAAFESAIPVNAKMEEAIEGYLHTAQRVGAEIPAAMKPILQSLIDQGLLTDEAGNAITDLEGAGITFAETMTQGFDRVVEKLNELIERLGMAAGAINGLPDVPSPNVGDWQERGTIPGADPSELQGFATGTGGRYLNFGKGTPVMLHGRERVMTEAEGMAQGGGLAAMAAAINGLVAQMARQAQLTPLMVRDQMLRTGR